MPFDHDDHYHRPLLRHLPRPRGRALDVDAIGPSAEAIEEARALSARTPGDRAPSLAAVAVSAAARSDVAVRERLRPPSASTGRTRVRAPVGAPALPLRHSCSSASCLATRSSRTPAFSMHAVTSGSTAVSG
ncbi:hypothetical protein [Streptomyces marincola]|uniref:hypothetical protein n=1 Tax=Streptomyces marincola TaxID=2878388 RepID=UPI001CF11D95|nr:hypothetical protein [Streptomyces marincola]UCM91036.1 hypothetical protein LC193_25525 [Streptomyces marincola]